jgi:hypothetical protein
VTPIRKAVYRVTEARVRDRGKMREIVVGIEPGDVLSFRLKGTRKAYILPITVEYQRAGILEGERIRAERRARRKGAKK